MPALSERKLARRSRDGGSSLRRLLFWPLSVKITTFRTGNRQSLLINYLALIKKYKKKKIYFHFIKSKKHIFFKTCLYKHIREQEFFLLFIFFYQNIFNFNFFIQTIKYSYIFFLFFYGWYIALDFT